MRIRALRLSTGIWVVLLAVGLAVPLRAQKTGQSPTDFYLSYIAAAEKMKSLKELVPFVRKEEAAMLGKMPKEMEKEFLEETRKETVTGVKVLKETPDKDGYLLEVEGTRKATGQKVKGWGEDHPRRWSSQARQGRLVWRSPAGSSEDPRERRRIRQGRRGADGERSDGEAALRLCVCDARQLRQDEDRVSRHLESVPSPDLFVDTLPGHTHVTEPQLVCDKSTAVEPDRRCPRQSHSVARRDGGKDVRRGEEARRWRPPAGARGTERSPA